jgi:CRP/FNR family cyclic AMP-dependent transcriptional regulator
LTSKFLDALSDDDRPLVVQACSRKRFARDETVFRQDSGGESMYIIERGKVAMLMRTPAGDEVTAMIMGVDESFGEFGVLSTNPKRTSTVVAIEPTDTLFLTRHAFNELRRHSPTIEEALFDSLNDRVARLAGQMRSVLFLPLETRVFGLLANLMPIYAKGTAPITITLTQTQIATMVGATRPTINQILRNAERDGLLQLGRGRVVILEPDGVRKAGE